MVYRRVFGVSRELQEDDTYPPAESAKNAVLKPRMTVQNDTKFDTALWAICVFSSKNRIGSLGPILNFGLNLGHLCERNWVNLPLDACIWFGFNNPVFLSQYWPF